MRRLQLPGARELQACCGRRHRRGRGHKDARATYATPASSGAVAAVAGCAVAPGFDERAHRDSTGDRAHPIDERAVAESRCAARPPREARRLGGRRSEWGTDISGPSRLSQCSPFGCCKSSTRPTERRNPEFDWLLPVFVRGLQLTVTHKTISLLQFESPQLWPLLDEARRVGVRLLQARPQRDMPTYATAQLCLDVTADERGDLTVAPALRVDGTTARPVAFIGRQAMAWPMPMASCGWLDWTSPPLRRCSAWHLADEPLVIPADEAPRFVTAVLPEVAPHRGRHLVGRIVHPARDRWADAGPAGRLPGRT